MKALPPRRAPHRYPLELTLISFLLLASLLLLFYSPKFNAAPALARFVADETQDAVTLPALSPEANLFFTSPDTLLLAAAEASVAGAGRPTGATASQIILGELPAEPAAPLPEQGAPSGEQAGHGGPSLVSGIFPSPNGSLLAVEYDHGSRPQVQLLDLTDRTSPKLTAPTLLGWHAFLAWRPDGGALLVDTRLEAPDPGLWLVNVADGSHIRIETPGLFASEGVPAAAFSPDGKEIVYAISNGLGLGSEVWQTDSEGREQRPIFKDEYTTIGSLSWSPDGTQIAFTKLLDSPVPFAEAGLWLMGRDGSEPHALALMDGGHGQEPVWSRDGQELYYVARENHDDTEADYKAELLVSSIRAISAQGGEPRTLVPADGARQIDLRLTAIGALIFVSNRQGTLDIWSVDAGGALTQVTADGVAKRHPVLLESGF